MKSDKADEQQSDGLRPEYRLDYSKAKPNRFADQWDDGPVVVVLDPDVAEVFKTPASANKALHALIKALQARRTSRAR